VKGGGAIIGRTRRRSRPMTGPQRRLRTINIVGSGTPKTAGGEVQGSVTGEAQRPSAPGRRAGESPPPVGRHWTREGWARETVSSGRVSSAAPWRTCQKARGRDAIADRMLGMEDQRPAVRRSRMMAVSTLMSALTRL